MQQEGTYDDDAATAVVEMTDGNVIAVGLTEGSLFDTNDGSFDIVAVKLRADNGDVIWTYQVGQS